MWITSLSHDAILQALFSACAKMCVRELRKTETANVSVFYLSFCSTIGAIVGCFGPKIFGYEHTVRLPYNYVECLLLLGVGQCLQLSFISPLTLHLMPACLHLFLNSYCSNELRRNIPAANVEPDLQQSKFAANGAPPSKLYRLPMSAGCA